MSTDLRLVPVVATAWVVAWTLTGPWTSVARPLTVVGALVALGCAAAVAAGVRRRGGPVGPVVAHGALVAACLVAVAASVAVQTAARGPLAGLADDGATATVDGRVVSSARAAVHGDGSRWVLAVDSVVARGVRSAAVGHVLVTAPGEPPRFGAAVRARVRLAPPSFGAGVVAAGRATTPVAESAPPGPSGRATHTLRTALLDVTDGLSDQARGLVPGAAVGDTSRVPAELEDALRVTGLTHVTAVSGSHFAIVLTAAGAACVALRAPPAVRVGLLAAVGVGFVLLVRPEPSVLRAAWTCAVTLVALVLGRPAAGFPALATAATVLLVVDPWQARSFGFALSCAATAGIVLLTGPLSRRLAPWCGRGPAFALAVPLAAQAACGPVLILLDPALPSTAVLANLLAAPALVPATVLALVATLAAPWAPGAAGAVAWLAGIPTGWIATVATTAAALPGARLPWLAGPGGAALLAVVTAVVLALVLRRPPGQGWPVGRAPADRLSALRRRVRLAHRPRRSPGVRGGRVRGSGGAATAGAVVLVTVLGVALGTVLVAPRTVPAAGVPPDWQVVACDVGQGDALVVRSGPRAAVVVDVGPPGDGAARCLRRLGVDRVDLLVLSHFHADHVGGLEGVLAGRTVVAALVSPLDDPADAARRTRAALARHEVPVEVAVSARQGTAGDVAWTVLGADAGAGGANEASVAIALRTAAGVDVVALGDLEEPGQERLAADLAAGGYPDGAVEVVKMAHHGSAAQSADLARRLAPGVVLVSVGQNDYGHPTRTALDLYRAVGSEVVRTDRCGTASLSVRAGGLVLACAG
ncbi:ComEC/Rec2 family competence protein [Isoptericola haloaureus]|uniref:ComEC/Rec2 family competence protein n=1 Tax=Isoptericola haloaureus TaxID=1542902 RepID=A0ABU7ZAT9_9MICO